MLLAEILTLLGVVVLLGGYLAVAMRFAEERPR